VVQLQPQILSHDRNPVPYVDIQLLDSFPSFTRDKMLRDAPQSTVPGHKFERKSYGTLPEDFQTSVL